MKKLDYRDELELDLMDCTTICRSSSVESRSARIKEVLEKLNFDPS